MISSVNEGKKHIPLSICFNKKKEAEIILTFTVYCKILNITNSIFFFFKYKLLQLILSFLMHNACYLLWAKNKKTMQM